MYKNNASHIESFKKLNEHDLYTSLWKLANESDNPWQFKDVFDFFFNYKSLKIKEVCIEALVFIMNENDSMYLEYIFEILTKQEYIISEENLLEENAYEKSQLKEACISSLGELHKNTKDKKSIKVLLSIFNNESESSYTRANSFQNALKIFYGMDASDFLKENGTLGLEYNDIKLEIFENRIKELNQL
jgi:hypothetical protein